MSVPKDNGEINNCNTVNVDCKESPEKYEESNHQEDDVLGWNSTKQPVDSEGNGPYVPGSLTDPEKRHESYDLLVDKAIEEVHGPQEDKTDKFWRKVAENAKNNEDISIENDEEMKNNGKKNKQLKLPVVSARQNFQFARGMHVGNLEHQPLPDTLGYRHLTKIAEHRDSDIVVKPYAIGWKGYGASGPTCCTKMRVHRPKTCDAKKSDVEVRDSKRPSTSAPELGRQYNKAMSLMDLAICWDFRPQDTKLEPRPPKHVDGSNGSKAPAVFTMVHTPKDEVEDKPKANQSNPIFNKNRRGDDLGYHPVPYFEKDMTKEKRKDSCDVQYCQQHGKRENSSNNSSRKHSNTIANKTQCDGINGCGTPSASSRKSSHDTIRPEKLHPTKEAWNITQINNKQRNKCNSLESYEKTSLAQGKLEQSSPEESQISRRSTKETISINNSENNNIKHKHCISCNGTSKPLVEVKPKESFKCAFKAGNPNSVQSSNNSQDIKNLKIPKMRHPYSKKSYSIHTLAPPFSIWRDANANGYPEHWRLASVYQHAYKPLDQRRKPLIASVYQ